MTLNIGPERPLMIAEAFKWQRPCKTTPFTYNKKTTRMKDGTSQTFGRNTEGENSCARLSSSKRMDHGAPPHTPLHASEKHNKHRLHSLSVVIRTRTPRRACGRDGDDPLDGGSGGGTRRHRRRRLAAALTYLQDFVSDLDAARLVRWPVRIQAAHEYGHAVAVLVACQTQA